jgi:putative flippase GtrA
VSTSSLLGAHARIARFIVVGVGCRFVLDRGWTFRSGAPRGPELAPFVLSQIAMLALSSTIIEIDVDVLRLPAAASRGVTTASVAVANHLALHHWVFRVPGTAAV